jgi:predicted dehydrogenase
MFKMAIVGLVHDHIWNYLDSLKEIPDAQITCASDVNPSLREKAKAALNLSSDSLYADHRAMLEKEHLDAALIFAENNRHADLTEDCARHGLHVMVEKPMASTLRDAERMLRVAGENNIRLMVNFPLFYNPAAAGCLRLIEENRIGRIWLLRYATGHAGPEKFCDPRFSEWLWDREKNGGGALIDFCAYGAALSTWYFGIPDRVTATGGNFMHSDRESEDHAIVTLRYLEQNRICLLEGTWATTPGGMVFNLCGETGTIFNNIGERNKFHLLASGSETAMDLEFQALSDEGNGPLKYFVSKVRKGEDFEGIVNPKLARNTQEILEAAKIALETNREVPLPLKR